jgi:hypothetical protein
VLRHLDPNPAAAQIAVASWIPRDAVIEYLEIPTAELFSGVHASHAKQ